MRTPALHRPRSRPCQPHLRGRRDGPPARHRHERPHGLDREGQQEGNAIKDALGVRVADTRYVLDALSARSQPRYPQAPPFSGMLDLDHVGMFGSSLGGATAAATMLIDRRLERGPRYGRLALPPGERSPASRSRSCSSPQGTGFRHNSNLAQFWDRLRGPATRSTSQAPPT